MTCIVAASDGKKVVMGGDSAAIQAHDMNLVASPKVFRVGPYALGFTTSFRMGQILRHAVELPPPPAGGDLERFLVTDFVDAIRAAFEAGGFYGRGERPDLGGCFIGAFGGQLFVLGAEFQLALPPEPYAAVGAGSRIAYGALHALGRRPELSLRDRAQAALEAAQEYNASVRAPFHFVSTEDGASSSRLTSQDEHPHYRRQKPAVTRAAMA